MNRRDFLQVVAAAAAAGLPVDARSALDLAAGASFYDSIERFGNVGLLHFTDCHAQLKPIFFREPSVNLGIGDAAGKPPHLVGEALLRHFGIRPGTREAHAFTFLDFERAAKAYGAVGGFEHLATLVKKLRASRPGALLLDGGDTWQGSATALWTKGQDMVDACKLLGVDVMTGHWEFTLGADRVKEIVEKDFAGKVDFVAQNVKTTDFGDPVFSPYVIRPVNGVRSGSSRCVLVVNPEITSAHQEWRDRDCHFIFGDVCTAILIERADTAVAAERWEVLGTRLATQFSNNIRNNFGFMNRCEDADPQARDKTFRQEGRKVFKEVVPIAAAHIEGHLAQLALQPDQVRRFWLHQANEGMNQLVIKKLVGTATADRAPLILDTFANTASAGSIIAFHQHRSDLQAGDVGVICSFGAGYSVGSVAVRKL